MTKNQFKINVLCSILLILILASSRYILFPFDTIEKSIIKHGSLHIVFNVLVLIIICSIIIRTVYLSLNSDWEFNFKIINETIEVRKKQVKYITTILLLIPLLFINSFYSKVKDINNASLDYHQKYDIKLSWYSYYINTLYQSYYYNRINKNKFKQIVDIIISNDINMENKSFLVVKNDMNKESFDEMFNKIKADVYSTDEFYDKNKKERNEIAYKNNKLLDRFPNSFFNKFIGCKHIQIEK